MKSLVNTSKQPLICPPELAGVGDDTRIHLVLPSFGLLSFLPCIA